MTKVTFPDPETLGVDEKLTDEQSKAIEDLKSADWVSEPEESAKTKEEEDGFQPKEKEETKPEETPPEKTAEELEAEKQAQEAEAVENKRLEEKAKELSKTVEEVRQIEATEKAEKERIEKIAKDEGKTIEEVKEEESNDRKVAERHGNDPLKISRALRKEQSEYGKLKNEVEELKKFKSKVEIEATKFQEKQFNSEMEKIRDKIVEKYCENNKEETEELSDDACFERGKAQIRKVIEEQNQAKAEKMKETAETKRVELIKTLPEEFKDFVPEVKSLLSECGDSQILDKEFDVNFLANYARGKKYTSEYIKSLEDNAYKRGIEQSKILPKVPAGKPTTTKSTKVELAEHQKRRAEEIYGRKEGWSKERMYEEYAKHDLVNDF